MKVHCSTCKTSQPRTGSWVTIQQGMGTYFFCSGLCEIKKLGVTA